MLRGHLRRHRSSALAAVVGFAFAALAAAAAAPAAEAACGGAKHVRASRNLSPGRAPLTIGDSVMLGALGEVARAGFDITPAAAGRSVRD